MTGDIGRPPEPDSPDGRPVEPMPDPDFVRPDDVPTTAIPRIDPTDPGTGGTVQSGSATRRRRIALGAAAGVLAVGGAIYLADLAMSSGDVPRGVTVAGVDVGGQPRDEAETTLRAQITPRIDEPVQVRAGDVTAQLVPAQADIAVDWDATMDRAGDQPLNPVTRLTSLFTHHEVGVSSTADEAAVTAAVEGLRSQTDRPSVEGGVVFEGANPVAVNPQPGQALDVPGAADEFTANWAQPGGVEMPVTEATVSVTAAAVDTAVRDIAAPAASGDVVVTGLADATAILPRDQIGTVLSFVPDGNGGLTPQYDMAAATRILEPQLSKTEVEPKDATFDLSGDTAVVVPAVSGETIDWGRTLEPLPQMLTRDPDAAGGGRTTAAVYEKTDPALTTEAANKLGIREVIGEFTTGGFEYASGVNIRLAADEINGAIVKPGETFSLNETTGPRGTAEGYLESGIINNGRPDRAVGGGISQLATTLYNAAYFAGMDDAGHREHSYYISRYPEAREATVYEGVIDIAFTNPDDTGVLIQTIGTGSNITVRLWGTKTVDVESITGDRTNPTTPNTITLPAGSNCIPSSGAPGFTARDTRVITDHETGRQISSDTRTVKYDPVPVVQCVSAPEPAPAETGTR